jgi:serum/glucocorticoid-regulated kinase 2
MGDGQSKPQDTGGKAPAPARRPSVVIDKKISVNDFDLLAVVGKGSFGKVLQVRKKDTGKIYAMKVLKKQHLVARKQVAHTITERNVLEGIDHPFVVSLRFAFQTDEKLYMVLDYFTGGELFLHLKNEGRFSESRARLYAAEIILALECLHKNDIIYRDLKPENLLLDNEGHIRLTDFGLSKDSIKDDGLSHTFCGTPEYLAPEVLQGQGHGKAVDWWSLGTLVYEMIVGLPPFYDQNVNVMYERILRAKLTFPPTVSPAAVSFLSGLLERDVKKRLGSNGSDADELRNHPFFKGLDWEKVFNKEVEPEFKPKGTGSELDTENVDEEFKREMPRDTPVVQSASKLAGSTAFAGFTYNPESKLGGI